MIVTAGVFVNALIFFAGLLLLSLIIRHYRFYKEAEGNLLARRIMYVFLSQAGDLASIIAYKIWRVGWPHEINYNAEFILACGQLLTTVFSCWATYKLYEIYAEHYEDKKP